MFKTKPEMKEIQVVSQVWCDMCGEEIPNKGCGHEFALLRASWGYDSGHDTDEIDAHLCEKCVYEKVVPMLTSAARSKIE